MEDNHDFLRRLYGPAIAFVVTLAFGAWFYTMREPHEGPFSSPLGVASIAIGAAIGQVIAGLIARRHMRR